MDKAVYFSLVIINGNCYYYMIQYQVNIQNEKKALADL